MINAVVAEIEKQSAVLQVYPANASYHELSLVDGELSLVQLGEQMETALIRGSFVPDLLSISSDTH